MTSKQIAACIFGLAFVLRLVMLFFTFQGNQNTSYFDDGKIAVNLVSGRGYSIDFNYRNWLFYEVFMKHKQLQSPVVEGVKPTASKQPVYPLLLALIFVGFGAKNFLAVFLLQALLSSVTSAVLFLTFRKMSNLTGLLVGIGTAVYPAFIFHSVTTPESTTLLLLLLSLFFMSLLRLNQASSSLQWILFGAIGGIMVLTEPVTLPFVVLCLLYAVYLMTRDNRRKLAGIGLAAAVFVLMQVPWLARNYVVFGRFPVMKSVVGVVFNWGLERSGRGSWISDDALASLEREGRYKSELEEDEAIRRELITLFPSHWKEYVTFNVPMNLVHFWWEVARYSDDRSITYLLGRKLPYVLLLIVALSAIWSFFWRLSSRPVETFAESPPEVSALILIITFTIVYCIFGAYMSRYRFPVELCLFVFFGKALASISERAMVKTLANSRLAFLASETTDD